MSTITWRNSLSHSLACSLYTCARARGESNLCMRSSHRNNAHERASAPPLFFRARLFVAEEEVVVVREAGSTGEGGEGGGKGMLKCRDSRCEIQII